jgi:hypothetical protein
VTLREYLAAPAPAGPDNEAAELHAIARRALLAALCALEAYGVAPAGLDADCVDPLAMLHSATDSARHQAEAIAGDLRREADVHSGRRSRVAKGSAAAVEAVAVACGRARLAVEATAPNSEEP